MAFQMRLAGWTQVHPAQLARRGPLVLVAGGAVAMLAGAGLFLATLAPMFGIGGETATIDDGALTAQSAAPGFALGPPALLRPVNKQAAPLIVDKPVNGVDFRIEVPAIGYRSNVFEGIDTRTLLRGPGHYPTSAWPGRDGTVAIAAHNVYWLSFSRLKAGDRVILRTSRGAFVYAITAIKVTSKTDVSVLEATSERRLTMTTCYPLWAGEFATKRLAFLAREIAGPAA